MPRRKVATALLVAAASFAARALWRRRGGARRADRVDLYYEDGSMVSFAEGSAEAARLLPLARRVLSAARS